MVHTELSVIIPTLNAAGTLKIILESLAVQDHPVSETIIIDSGSTDQTIAIAEYYGTKVITIPPEDFDHGATRNRAASLAKGEILIFITQDAIPLDTLLINNLIKPLADPEVALSYARQIASTSASSAEQFLRLNNYPQKSLLKNKDDIPFLGIKTFFCSNACAAYNHRHFDKLGGFPEPVVCNEDMLFAVKAINKGLKVAYRADAVVAHTHNLSVKQTFKRYFDISASLDHAPQVRHIGAVTTKGFAFLKEELAYIKRKKEYLQLPMSVTVSAAKYLGYKAGQYHSCLPLRLKKYIGSNTLYWRKLEAGNHKPACRIN